MFGIGSTELLVILLVALIVMGPRKLPQIARSMGKAFGEFKRVSSGFKQTIDMEVQRVEKEEKQAKAKKELLVDDASPDGDTPAAAVSPELATPPADTAAAEISLEDSFEAEFDAEEETAAAAAAPAAETSSTDAKEPEKA